MRLCLVHPYFGLLRVGDLERDAMLVTVSLWLLALRTAWLAKLFERFCLWMISTGGIVLPLGGRQGHG